MKLKGICFLILVISLLVMAISGFSGLPANAWKEASASQAATAWPEINTSAAEEAAPSNPEIAPSVSFVQMGLTGEITADMVITSLAEDSDNYVILGTSDGLYIVSQGSLWNYIPTPGPVTDIAVLSDVTGDGQREFVISVYDTYFPNIRCYEANGDIVWQFSPRQQVFVENLLWIERQTLSFNVEVLDDIDADGYPDVAVTSGYYLYMLSGRSGDQIWKFEATNNMWQVTATPDMDGDGVADLAVGGQNGYLYQLSGKDGTLLWQVRVAQKYKITDNQGGNLGDVERSVWDIVPLDAHGGTRAVVSSEDGVMRLIDLRDGSVIWETQVIAYIDSLLFEYYRQIDKQPTGPTDEGFFNLRALVIEDISGDGTPDILATAWAGSEQMRQMSGIMAIDAATGRLIWEGSGLSLDHVVKVETVYRNGEQLIVLPQGVSGYGEEIILVDPEDGETVEIIEIPSAAEPSRGNLYRVQDFGDDSFVMVSDYGDLVLLSADEVRWHYPRITAVTVEEGDFTGDDTEDLLIRSQSVTERERSGESKSRVLHVIDGATRKLAWSYEVPYEEFVATGGIGALTITPDLNGDGKLDIAGVIQPPWEQIKEEEKGEKSQIIVFSGSDGAILLQQPVVTQTYYGAWDELYKDPSLLEQSLREEFEIRMETEFIGQWSEQEEERRQEFDNELQQNLDQWRQEGWSGGDIANFEQQERQRFEKELEDGRQNWERSWREQFEDEELPRQLEEWQNRLENEEEWRTIDKRIISFGVAQYRDGGPGSVVFMVSTPRELYLISPQGDPLWTQTFDPNPYQDPVTGQIPPNLKVAEEGRGWERSLVLDDLNGDGGDDLAAITNDAIYISITDIDPRSGDLDFRLARTIEVGEGIDGQRVRLVEDIDGDGIRDISFLKHRDRQPPLEVIVSPVSGQTLLELEVEGGDFGSTFDLAVADFDGDGGADTLAFQLWSDANKRSMLDVVDSSGKVLWQFTGYREPHLYWNLQQMGEIPGGRLYIMPATPIRDISGDGVPDLALIEMLPFQAGARVLVYDVLHDILLKEITVEEVDKRGREEWNPGLLATEVGDVNGDGTPEIAFVVALGDTLRAKKWQLLVVDIAGERVIADFHIAASQIFELAEGAVLGVVGRAGEVYFLNLTSSLAITSPIAGSRQTSPLKIEWGGIASGAFSQVFVDDILVRETNESEVTIPLAAGEHEVQVRSVDEYGKGSYTTVRFDVDKPSLLPTVAILGLVISILLAASPRLWGRFRKYRRRGRYG